MRRCSKGGSEIQAAAHRVDRRARCLEVGAQVEERGHDHISGGSDACMEEEYFHGSSIPIASINANDAFSYVEFLDFVVTHLVGLIAGSFKYNILQMINI